MPLKHLLVLSVYHHTSYFYMFLFKSWISTWCSPCLQLLLARILNDLVYWGAARTRVYTLPVAGFHSLCLSECFTLPHDESRSSPPRPASVPAIPSPNNSGSGVCQTKERSEINPTPSFDSASSSSLVPVFLLGCLALSQASLKLWFVQAGCSFGNSDGSF